MESEDVYQDDLMQVDVEINKIRENNNESDDNKNPLDDNYDGEESLGINDSEDYEPSEISDEDNETEKKSSKSDNKKSRKPAKKKSQKKNTSNSKSSTNDDSVKKKRMSHRMDPILTEEIIKKHIPMACNLCVYVGETFSDITEHFKQHHDNVKAFIMCCDKKFTRSYCIAQHAYIHENPNSFRYNS